MNLASRFSRHASTIFFRLDREISLTCRGIQRRIGGSPSPPKDSQVFFVFLHIVIYLPKKIK